MSLEMCETNDAECCFYCVLVPGYGFRWVRQDDVVDLKDWVIDLPLTSSLTSFECGDGVPETQTMSLLSSIGSNLTALLLDDIEMLSTVLDIVAQTCPKVQHVELADVYEYRQFSRDSLTRFFLRSRSQLRSLVVDWKLCNIEALMNALSPRGHTSQTVATLKELFIYKIDEPAEYYGKIFLMENMLRANKSLERLCLTTSIRKSRATLAREPRLLAFGGEDLTQQFTPLRQRLAFLSVVHNDASQKPEEYAVSWTRLWSRSFSRLRSHEWCA